MGGDRPAHRVQGHIEAQGEGWRRQIDTLRGFETKSDAANALEPVCVAWRSRKAPRAAGPGGGSKRVNMRIAEPGGGVVSGPPETGVTIRILTGVRSGAMSLTLTGAIARGSRGPALARRLHVDDEALYHPTRLSVRWARRAAITVKLRNQKADAGWSPEGPRDSEHPTAGNQSTDCKSAIEARLEAPLQAGRSASKAQDLSER